MNAFSTKFSEVFGFATSKKLSLALFGNDSQLAIFEPFRYRYFALVHGNFNTFSSIYIGCHIVGKGHRVT